MTVAESISAPKRCEIASVLGVSGGPVFATGAALDSRLLTPGDAFVALAGDQTHGLQFLRTALDAGAVAVVVDSADAQHAALAECTVPVLCVPQLREALPKLARAVYGNLDQLMTLCGVTGTDGKTSTAFFLAQLLHGGASRCAVLGTVGNGFLDHLETSTHTTADVLALHANLSRFAKSGATSVAMEVSSHALDQARIGSMRLAVGALTGLGRDHLDYHGTLENYRQAKRKLFTEHAQQWVLNLDDDMGRELFAEREDAVGFSLDNNPAARWRAEVVSSDADGMLCRIAVGDAPAVERRLSVLGRFNLANVLAACAMAECVGVEAAEILARVSDIKPVVGRLDVIREEGQARVVIDYAHTEQALASAIAALRDHVSGRLWCVFGCGGDRDPGKRAGMARAACLADRVVLTSDNPRSESPEAIARDAQAGLVDGVEVDTLLNREEAIVFAVSQAQPSDCVLIAGKGHETYQDINGERVPFSDHDVVHSWHRRCA